MYVLGGKIYMFENIYMIITKYSALFINGTIMTLQFSAIALCGGVFFGMILTFMKRANKGIGKLFSFLATAYIEVLRGTPILLHLYFFYFFLAEAIPGVELSDTQAICLALICNSAAYVAEIFRSGIESVDPGQMEAARCLGLSSRQAMMKVIMPQAVKNVLPALCNEFIMMIKETSLASTFFIGEIMTQYRTISSVEYLVLEPLMIIAAIYFCLTFTLSKVVSYIERRMGESD